MKPEEGGTLGLRTHIEVWSSVMNEALTLTFAAAVPFFCLGLLLLLARLEDTLTDGLEAAEPTLEPAPVAATVAAPEPTPRRAAAA